MAPETVSPVPKALKPVIEEEGHEDVLPAIIKPESKSPRPILPGDNEKPALAPESEHSVPKLPELQKPGVRGADDESRVALRPVEEDGQKKKGGLFGKLLGGRKREKQSGKPVDTPRQSSEATLPPLPKPSTEGPEPDLPPLPATALAPPKTAADIPALPPLPSSKSDLPPLPASGATDSAKELERKTLERKLERIADERAQRLKETDEEVSPKSVLPKPGEGPGGLPSLPSAGGEKPALPSLPKPVSGPGGLPSLPKPGAGPGGLPSLPKPG